MKIWFFVMFVEKFGKELQVRSDEYGVESSDEKTKYKRCAGVSNQGKKRKQSL